MQNNYHVLWFISMTWYLSLIYNRYVYLGGTDEIIEFKHFSQNSEVVDNLYSQWRL